MKWTKLLVWTVPCLLLVGGGAYFWSRRAAGPAAAEGAPSAFRTAPVSRTDIVRTVSATGTITPRNTSSGIPVGAQVNGKLI